MKIKMKSLIIVTMLLATSSVFADYSSSVGNANQANSQYYSSSGSTQTNSNYYSSGGTAQNNQTYYSSKHRQHHHRNLGPKWVNQHEGAPLPDDAVVGGAEAGNVLYVCRGFFQGAMHPGRFDRGRCYIGWGGNQVSLASFQILTSHKKLHWGLAGFGYVPANAVVGGKENKQTRYVCQAVHHNNSYPGKVVGGRCNVAAEGKEVSTVIYKVLVR